jgi:nucleotide-binding universal stress UspA family protein
MTMHWTGTRKVKDHSIRALRRPFSRIVVGVDDSPAAESAAQLAVSLARGDTRAELVFCHSIDIQRMVSRSGRLADDYPLAFDTSQEAARRLLDHCCRLAWRANVPARSYVRLEKPSFEVTSMATELNADLIVIGNQPRDRVLRFLCGSTRDEIVRTATIPVLLADPHPTQATAFRPDCIVAALADPSASTSALQLASNVALAYGTRMVLCSGGDGGCVLERGIAEHQPGMIVIGDVARRGLRNLFTTSVVERTLQSAAAPVLIVRG